MTSKNSSRRSPATPGVSSNIGVYFWSVVAAHDMGLIDDRAELERVSATLGEVERLSKWNGFLFSWYDTTNGHHIDSPGGPDLEGKPAKGQLISTVDNGWYASGLILVRQEFPEELGERGDQAAQCDGFLLLL